MITKAQVNQAFIYGVMPVLVGAANIAVVRFGHAFSLFTKVGLFGGGLIGLVQGVASQALYQKLSSFIDSAPMVIDIKCRLSIAAITIFTVNVACAAILIAISVVAVKVGILASPIAVSGIVFLTLANTALSMAGLVLHALILSELKKRNFLVN